MKNKKLEDAISFGETITLRNQERINSEKRLKEFVETYRFHQEARNKKMREVRVQSYKNYFTAISAGVLIYIFICLVVML